MSSGNKQHCLYRNKRVLPANRRCGAICCRTPVRSICRSDAKAPRGLTAPLMRALAVFFFVDIAAGAASCGGGERGLIADVRWKAISTSGVTGNLQHEVALLLGDGLLYAVKHSGITMIAKMRVHTGSSVLILPSGAVLTGCAAAGLVRTEAPHCCWQA